LQPVEHGLRPGEVLKKEFSVVFIHIWLNFDMEKWQQHTVPLFIAVHIGNHLLRCWKFSLGQKTKLDFPEISLAQIVAKVTNNNKQNLN
jgi:hypothetical protein